MMEPTHEATSIKCMACRTRVDGEENRREHYRSDWHRTNLRRKVSGLPPLSWAEHEDEEALRAAANTNVGDGAQYCTLCSKRFSSIKAMEQHVRSDRHWRQTVAHGLALPSAGGAETADLGEPAIDPVDARLRTTTAIPVGDCFFCGSGKSAYDGLESLLSHMAKAHGFFVHYLDNVEDLSGLLEYLGQKVGIGFACVACDKPHVSVDAARDHMTSKAHCHMVEEEGSWCTEYLPFYNFDEYDGIAPEPAEWVEVAENSSSALDPIGAEETERLFLPSGGMAGHRSMNQYFRQRPRVKDRADSTSVKGAKSVYRRIANDSNAGVSFERTRPSPSILERARRNHLAVGRRGYFSQKAKLRPSMSLLNSGYRP